jgi:uncharacterized protein YbaA (DUF1428 family)
MTRYINGFVIPVPKDRLEDYRQMAEKSAGIWKGYGALDYWECVGDDLESSEHHTATFLQIAGAQLDETVIFAWVVYESKEKRDEVNAKIMDDPRMKEMMNDVKPVFDPKRMAYGGFRELVQR